MALPLEQLHPLQVGSRLPAAGLECVEVLAYDLTNAEQIVRWLDDPRLAYEQAGELFLLHAGTGRHLPVLQECAVIFERRAPGHFRYTLRTSSYRAAEIVFALERILPADHQCRVFDPAPSLGLIHLSYADPKHSVEVSCGPDQGFEAPSVDIPATTAEPERTEHLTSAHPGLASTVGADVLIRLALAIGQLVTTSEDVCVDEQGQFVPELGTQAAFDSLHQLRDFRVLMRRV